MNKYLKNKNLIFSIAYSLSFFFYEIFANHFLDVIYREINYYKHTNLFYQASLTSLQNGFFIFNIILIVYLFQRWQQITINDLLISILAIFIVTLFSCLLYYKLILNILSIQFIFSQLVTIFTIFILSTILKVIIYFIKK